jgi:hypothetical protein
MGFEPMTPVLPRLCATTAPHGPAKLPVRHRIYLKASAFGQRDDAHPFLTCHRTGHSDIASRQRRRRQSFGQASPQRNHESRTAWWAVEDSNLRRLPPTDLQSVPIVHSGNRPYIFYRSRWSGSNRQPTVYKTVALPLSYIGLPPQALAETGFPHSHCARSRTCAWVVPVLPRWKASALAIHTNCLRVS